MIRFELPIEEIKKPNCMVYIVIGAVLLVLLLISFKRMARHSNTPENGITYYYQALELEFFKANPKSQMDASELDKSLLCTAGFFYSTGKGVSVKLDLDEITLIAKYTIDNYEERPDRIGFFVMLYKVALIAKENDKEISFEENSYFIRQLDKFDASKTLEVVQRHLHDGEAPIGHQAVTKRRIEHYPNWLQLDFN